MHPCFNVDEIVRLLACQLVASKAEATAVSLACCCKILEDPVLATLWAKAQHQLGPLLRCLPQEVWEEEDGIFVSQAKFHALYFPCSYPLFESLSLESRRKMNGSFSKSTLGECGSSKWMASKTPYLRKFSFCCNSVPPTPLSFPG